MLFLASPFLLYFVEYYQLFRFLVNWQNMIPSIILFAIFSTLGFIHFYWSFGGKWGLENALPTKGIGEKAIEPPKVVTIIVGIVLILFGIVYLIKAGIIHFQVPNWVITYGSWIIPSIFILRAIGDFNYVGLFKKVKNTKFAKADTKWFIPLCLAIGVLGILVQLMDS